MRQQRPCAATPAQRSTATPGFLRRLARDEGGNALAIMAASILPLIGVVGGAVDMSRLYISKTRLQQACDAGALAGRKVMGNGDWASNNNAASKAALEFFDGNFKGGSFGTGGLTRAYSEAEGKVTGTASVQVPMTLMRVFGMRDDVIAVTCDAEMRLPNTDIMFVLDTTGSMGQTIPGDTAVKIDTLKYAVKCFYETLARQDTAADCGSVRTGGVGNNVQIRFGFMPYSTNVNVGRQLPTNYFADRWPYQSREQITSTETYYSYETPGTPAQTGSAGNENEVYSAWRSTKTTSKVSSDWCRDNQPPYSTPVSTGPESAPYDEKVSYSGTTRVTTYKTRQPHKQTQTGRYYDRGTCYHGERDLTYDLVRIWQRSDQATQNTRQVFNQWRYAKITHDISKLKNGTVWNQRIDLPVGNTGSLASIPWDGCIEERATVKQASYWPIPAGARDLDIDLIPNAAQADTLWGPALPDLVFERGKLADGSGNRIYDPINTTTNYRKAASYACPAEAAKLQKWMSPSGYEAYVDALAPGGNTYHDIGLLWGARFMSPTGIFRPENEFTPNGGDIERHLIFMTDGETCTSNGNYQAYGILWYDRRTTDSTIGGCESASSDGGALSVQVNQRFNALCNAVKNKNVTLWVVYFGSAVDTTKTRMTNCATSGRFFEAKNSAALIANFKSIADQISQLRLTN